MNITDCEILPDLPEAEYHASSGLGPGQYVTRSMLHCTRQSQSGFWLRYVEEHKLAKFNGNKSTDLGDLVEALVLHEPMPSQLYPREYLTKSGSVSTGAAVTNAIEEDAKNGIKYHKQEEQDKAELMADEVLRTPDCADLLGKMVSTQLTIRCKWFGVPFQIRLDMDTEGPLVDLKTSKKHPDNFAGAMRDYGYDMQAVDYKLVYEAATGVAKDFEFIVVQNSFPFTAKVKRVPNCLLHDAYKHSLKAIKFIAEGLATDWQNVERSREASELHLPLWMLNEMDAED